MRTIRMNVFETNSSSMHAFTYPKGTEPTLRDKSEFPLPDENGLLEIELDTYWKSYNPKCTTDNVERIIQYFAAQTICSNKYEKKVDEQGKVTYELNKEILEQNRKDFLEMLNIVYKEFGLPEIKDYRCYTLTVDGYTVYIDGNEPQDYRHCAYDPDDMSKEEYDAMIQRFHEDTDYPDCPMLAHHIGVSANCLTGDSFMEAIQYFGPEDWREDLYDTKYEMPLDLLRRHITLTFWHS